MNDTIIYIQSLKTKTLFFLCIYFSLIFGLPCFLYSNNNSQIESNELEALFYLSSNTYTLSNHDEEGHLQSIQLFTNDHALISTTKFLQDSTGRLVKLDDAEGNGFEQTYNLKGNLLSESLQNNGNTQLKTHYLYDQEGNLTSIELVDDQSKIENNESSFFSSIWQNIKHSTYYLRTGLELLRKKISYETYLEKELDGLAETLFDKGFLQFAGYYQDPVERGVSEGVELNGKVRVTLINGILNIRRDLEILLKAFSSAHGHLPIHYIFRPTEGWTKDILTCSLSKIGFTSVYAKLLAQTWKELITEMGGIGKGGKIIHYAHSIGATDTYVARNLLSPEEKQMIQIITLGSPTIIPRNSGFQSVTNYISKRDGVCLLDPVGYYMGILYNESEIELIGSSDGIPLIDHTLYTDSYGELIKELGASFLNIHQQSIK